MVSWRNLYNTSLWFLVTVPKRNSNTIKPVLNMWITPDSNLKIYNWSPFYMTVAELNLIHIKHLIILLSLLLSTKLPSPSSITGVSKINFFVRWSKTNAWINIKTHQERFILRRNSQLSNNRFLLSDKVL